MTRRVVGLMVTLAAVVLYPGSALAHCDAMDGPVVQAARAALEKRDISPVLRWVSPEREGEIRAAFDRTLAVRALGGDARALADTWFFETVVRTHRAGEGAPFDGLKPAGHIEPFIAAVDHSIASGAPEEVLTMVSGHVAKAVRERFARVRDAGAKADSSVEAGRAYVAAYVDYLHYVEALLSAGGTPEGEHREMPAGGHIRTP